MSVIKRGENMHVCQKFNAPDPEKIIRTIEKRTEKDKTISKYRRCNGQYFEDGLFHNFKLGYFHQWGCDYEEFADVGVGNYSIAIVELPNGKIVTPVAKDIEFIDKMGE